MKIKILLLLILFLISPVNADECSISCPAQSLKVIEKENYFNKLSGVNFTSKKIAQTIIQKEINDSLKSKIKADLKIFTVKRLKQGEFESLSLKSKNINYRAFSMSDFYARTICPFNKIVYKKGRIFYPVDLPFKYKASITNQDIQNIINSQDFQKELAKNPVKINEMKIVELKTPDIKIKDNKLYFELPVKTLFGIVNIKFNSDIEVEENKVILKNITFNSKNNILNNSVLAKLTEKINPFSYKFNSINGRYCKIFITKAKISDNIINTEGIFVINKNYNGEK